MNRMARGSLGAAKGLVAGPSRLMSAWPIDYRGFLRPMASMGLDGCSHAGGSSSSAEFSGSTRAIWWTEPVFLIFLVLRNIIGIDIHHPEMDRC